jgi:hypothetical protein
MAATNLVAVTRTSDGVTVYVGSTKIRLVEPVGSGSRIYFEGGDGISIKELVVNESPSTIHTATNA